MRRKFLVTLYDTPKRFDLREPLCLSENTITVDSLIINWSLQNADNDVKYTIFENGAFTFYRAAEGYMTFNDFITYFAQSGVILKAVPISGKCTLENKSGGILGLGTNLATLLGFTTYQINDGEKVTSQKVVNVNAGLEYIKIHCDAVDERLNYSNRDGTMSKSKVLAISPLPTGPLSGVTQHIVHLGKGVPAHNGHLNNLEFRVTDQNNREVDVGVVAIHISIE